MSKLVLVAVAAILLCQVCVAIMPPRFLAMRSKITFCSHLKGMSGCSGTDAWACFKDGNYACVTQPQNPANSKESSGYAHCIQCAVANADEIILGTDNILASTIQTPKDLPSPLVIPSGNPPPVPKNLIPAKGEKAPAKKWTVSGNLPKDWKAAGRVAPVGRLTPDRYDQVLKSSQSSRADGFITHEKLGKISKECEQTLNSAHMDDNRPPATTMEEDDSFKLGKLQCPEVPAIYGYATSVYTALNCAIRNSFPGKMVRYSEWTAQLEKDILNLPAPSVPVYRAQYVPFDPVKDKVYVNGNFWSSAQGTASLSSFLGGRSKLLTWTNVSGGELPAQCVKFAGESEVLQLPYTCWKVKDIKKASSFAGTTFLKEVDVIEIEPVTCEGAIIADFW